MEHAVHLVDLVNEHGQATGKKARQAIDKAHDTYHTIFLLVRTPRSELVLAKIPARQDLPNRYAGRLGSTAATIRRNGETAPEAAQRAAKTELSIDVAEPRHLGSHFARFKDGSRTYLSAFMIDAAAPSGYSRVDIANLACMSIGRLERALNTNPGDFTPTLHEIWHHYQQFIAK